MESPDPEQHYSAARETVIHEAGHAVIAYLLGRPFVRMTIDPEAGLDDDALGQVEHAAPQGAWFDPELEVNARTRQFLEAHIQIALAGAEAQEAWYERIGYRPPDADEHLRIGARHDYSAAVSLALINTGGDPDEAGAYIEWLRMRVRNKIRHDFRFWMMAEPLADALLAEKTVSWKRARAVMKAALDDWSAEGVKLFLARTRG